MQVIIIIMRAKIIMTLYIKNVTGALYRANYNENTLSMSLSVNAAWNSVVLTARRNDCSEVAALTDEGRALQARAAATGKARWRHDQRRRCSRPDPRPETPTDLDVGGLLECLSEVLEVISVVCVYCWTIKIHVKMTCLMVSGIN